MLCAIWYHRYNFKKVKNTHGGVIFLVKVAGLTLQLYQKYHSSMGVFQVFKIVQIVPNRAKHHIQLTFRKKSNLFVLRYKIKYIQYRKPRKSYFFLSSGRLFKSNLIFYVPGSNTAALAAGFATKTSMFGKWMVKWK